ncbi:MAG TPA: chemotaxis protein CheX [Turneriella sp.]|nr:chemotaxis protein CheX [Turneriella sp.]
MLDFNIFITILRHVFRDFIGVQELISEEMITLPEKFQSVTAKMELTGSSPATLWLNMTELGIKIAMKKLAIPQSDEDRMLMDTVGELLNIIVGTAQRQSAVRYDFSLPTALKGENYPLRFNENSRRSAHRFIFEQFEALLILEE